MDTTVGLITFNLLNEEKTMRGSNCKIRIDEAHQMLTKSNLLVAKIWKLITDLENAELEKSGSINRDQYTRLRVLHNRALRLSDKAVDYLERLHRFC